MKTKTQSREDVVNAIQIFYDNEVIGFYPINQRTISDIKDEETKLYKRSLYIGDYQFHTRLGVLYDGMKKRCLIGGSAQNASPHYIGTTMCEEWANSFDGFDSFAEWASKEIGFYQLDERGCLFEIDKDLLGCGRKLYSPETSTMLSNAINMALTGARGRGYYKTPNGKFSARISKHGKSVHIGTFDTEKQASAAYKKERRAYLRELAKKYKHQLSVAAYDALMAYKQA